MNPNRPIPPQAEGPSSSAVSKGIRLTLTLLLGLFMILGGIQHFLKPAFYLPFVPAFLPLRHALVLGSGLLEIALGLATLWPRWRHLGTKGVLLLMITFLPIHAWDVISAHPAIGSHTAALIRLPIQFLFIAWAWFCTHQTSRKEMPCAS